MRARKAHGKDHSNLLKQLKRQESTLVLGEKYHPVSLLSVFLPHLVTLGALDSVRDLEVPSTACLRQLSRWVPQSGLRSCGGIWSYWVASGDYHSLRRRAGQALPAPKELNLPSASGGSVPFSCCIGGVRGMGKCNHGARLPDKTPDHPPRQGGCSLHLCDATQTPCATQGFRSQSPRGCFLSCSQIPTSVAVGLLVWGYTGLKKIQRRRRGQSNPHLRLLRRSKVLPLLTPLLLFFRVSDWPNIINT